MKITYKNNKIKKVCTNVSEAEKRHGIEMAEKIMLRLDKRSAALSVETLTRFRMGRCHLFMGTRKNQFADDLVPLYRLGFER